MFVEILTDGDRYPIDWGQEGDTAVQVLEKVKAVLESGGVFKGDQGELVYIPPTAVLKHILIAEKDPRILDFEDLDADIPAVDSAPCPDYDVAEGPVPFTARVNYLGTVCGIKGIEYRTQEGRSYYAPLMINGNPAQEVVKHNNLRWLMDAWRLEAGDEPGRYDIVLVPQEILPDEEEITEYLKDLADHDRKLQDIDLPISQKTARAYFRGGDK